MIMRLLPLILLLLLTSFLETDVFDILNIPIKNRYCESVLYLDYNEQTDSTDLIYFFNPYNYANNIEFYQRR